MPSWEGFWTNFMTAELSKLETMRHSAAHVMAAAVQRLWPDALFDIGPSTADGFYYDFDLKHRLTVDDFKAIEAEMKKIVKEAHPFVREEKTRDEVMAMMKERGQTYKLERLSDIPEGETISLYSCGDFTDLCRGPHVETTRDVKAYKLQSVAGAYFRGDEKNAMMQRLYGTAFEDKGALAKHLKMLKEAKLRDHRVIGRDLDLFSIQETVGPGLVHWHPKGARIRSIIEDFWRREHYRNGYEMVYTPHVGRANLWETSGHLGFYNENMYAPMDVDEQRYYIKPMNCPFHIQIYKNSKRSYRELPIRWADLGTVYRYERTGVLHGLMRVRGFTQDDAHVFCTEDQLEAEILKINDLMMSVYKDFGFDEVLVKLATRPEKRVGSDESWDHAESILKRSLEKMAREDSRIKTGINEGEGTFYGPKFEYTLRDAIGREWQCGTTQVDFNLPEPLGAIYIDAHSEKQTPVMIHRAMFGSLERFTGILIENFAGHLPLWMAPQQAVVATIVSDADAYAEEVLARLKAAGLRAEIDLRNEKINYKVREHSHAKVPHLLVVGNREAQEGTVAVRTLGEQQQKVMSLDEAIAMLKDAATPPDLK
ncbi:MAG: threonine--tRNA ligase [Oricola sp.]|nr:threonine--tRNA ligase [Oricola sp.]